MSPVSWQTRKVVSFFFLLLAIFFEFTFNKTAVLDTSERVLWGSRGFWLVQLGSLGVQELGTKPNIRTSKTDSPLETYPNISPNPQIRTPTLPRMKTEVIWKGGLGRFSRIRLSLNPILVRQASRLVELVFLLLSVITHDVRPEVERKPGFRNEKYATQRINKAKCKTIF